MNVKLYLKVCFTLLRLVWLQIGEFQEDYVLIISIGSPSETSKMATTYCYARYQNWFSLHFEYIIVSNYFLKPFALLVFSGYIFVSIDKLKIIVPSRLGCGLPFRGWMNFYFLHFVWWTLWVHKCTCMCWHSILVPFLAYIFLIGVDGEYSCSSFPTSFLIKWNLFIVLGADTQATTDGPRGPGGASRVLGGRWVAWCVVAIVYYCYRMHFAWLLYNMGGCWEIYKHVYAVWNKKELWQRYVFIKGRTKKTVFKN